MKCPSCKNPLREKGAGGLTLDVCYGGCGGIWPVPSGATWDCGLMRIN